MLTIRGLQTVIWDFATGRLTFALDFSFILIKTSAAMNLGDGPSMIELQCNALIGKLQPALGSAFMDSYYSKVAMVLIIIILYYPFVFII